MHVRRKRKAARLPVEDKLLVPEALEMDKDANSNNNPKRDTNCMVCCISLVVLISQCLQTVETRTDETKTKLVVTTMGMTRRMTQQSCFVSSGK